MYLIARADLSAAQQAVQAAHALQEFNVLYPQEAMAWHTESNTLAFLSVSDEASLGVLLEKVVRRGIPVAAFREPDRGDELTAIAIGPSGKRLTRGLRLALDDDPQKGESNRNDRRTPLPLDGQSTDV
jgi:hypothetical protein